MIVGLTGGIGSGKSTVAKIFAQLKVPIYDADTEAKKLLDSDKKLHADLVELLGKSVETSEGKIDRAAMAGLIFKQKNLLVEVNALVHPAVAKHFQKWYGSGKSTYVIREAAILFESGSYKDCDAVITIFAPVDVRIARVMKRNGISKSEVESRISNQWPEEEKLKRADFVVYNDGSKSLIKQVLAIHENLIRTANSAS